MNKFESMAADYNKMVGHDRNFLCVQDDNGTIRLVINNTLMDVEDYNDKVENVDGAIIMGYTLMDEPTIDSRLENLAISAVQKGVRLSTLLETTGALVAQQGIDPASPEGKDLVMSMPDRVAKQPNAGMYMLLAMFGD